MFDRQLLKGIDLSKGECRLHESGLSVENPGDSLVLRPLSTDDYDKGKLDIFLLSKFGISHLLNKWTGANHVIRLHVVLLGHCPFLTKYLKVTPRIAKRKSFS